MKLALALPIALALAAPLAAQEGKKGEKKKRPDAPAEADKALARKLEQKKVTVVFEAQPIARVTGFLQDLTATPVVLGPGIDPAAPATLKVKDLSASSALKLALKQVGDDLEMKVWNGVVWLGKKGHELPALPVPPETADSPLAQTMTLNFAGIPFAHFKGFLVDMTGLEVVLDEKAQARLAEARVLLRIDDCPLYRLLPLIQALYGIEGKIEGTALKFVSVEEKEKE